MPAAMSPAVSTAREVLEIAGCIIDRQIQDDRCYPDLSELLVVPVPGSPTVPGMSDMDYPLQGPGLLSIPNLPEISSVRRVPLPPELVEQFGRILMKNNVLGCGSVVLIYKQMTTCVDGHSWALSSINDFKVQKIVAPLNKDIIPITDSLVVVQQYMLPPKKFVLLSAQGSFMFHKLRPVNQLQHLLVSNIGGDGEEIERFFELHQEDQACATCFILACSNAACDREVSAWATRAFFRRTPKLLLILKDMKIKWTVYEV